MTELVQHQPAAEMTAQMDYARAVSTATILPQAYRGKPADIMIAIGLGAAMGLSQAESLYRIDVIQGTPTAGAELIASNVRKAGHVLRVRVDEQNVSVTATVIRKDDPDFEHTVVRDMAWARRMGLDTKDNYKKQPLTMLQWRAISAVARLAASEALYGVGHTADELQDLGTIKSTPAVEAKPRGMEGLRAAVAPTPETVDEPLPVSPDEADDPMTDRTRKQMFALFGERGIADEEQLPGINHVTGKQYESRADLTEADALIVIEQLRADS